MATSSNRHARSGEVLAMLRAFINGLSASARSVERHTGVTNAQLFLMQELSHGSASLGDLAERARTQPSTVSIVIGRLQRAGLVTRVRAADDRRRVVISLTPDGRRLLRRAPIAPTARLLEAVEGLSPPGLRALTHGLGPLLDRLGITHASPPMLFEHSATPRRAGAERRPRGDDR